MLEAHRELLAVKLALARQALENNARREARATGANVERARRQASDRALRLAIERQRASVQRQREERQERQARARTEYLAASLALQRERDAARERDRAARADAQRERDELRHAQAIELAAIRRESVKANWRIGGRVSLMRAPSVGAACLAVVLSAPFWILYAVACVLGAFLGRRRR